MSLLWICLVITFVTDCTFPLCLCFDLGYRTLVLVPRLNINFCLSLWLYSTYNYLNFITALTWSWPDLPQPSRLALAPTQPPVQWVSGSLSRGWSGRSVVLTLYCHLAPKFKKKLSYTFTLSPPPPPFEPRWPVIGRTLLFLHCINMIPFWSHEFNSTVMPRYDASGIESRYFGF